MLVDYIKSKIDYDDERGWFQGDGCDHDAVIDDYYEQRWQSWYEFHLNSGILTHKNMSIRMPMQEGIVRQN